MFICFVFLGFKGRKKRKLLSQPPQPPPCCCSRLLPPTPKRVARSSQAGIWGGSHRSSSSASSSLGCGGGASSVPPPPLPNHPPPPPPPLAFLLLFASAFSLFFFFFTLPRHLGSVPSLQPRCRDPLCVAVLSQPLLESRFDRRIDPASLAGPRWEGASKGLRGGPNVERNSPGSGGDSLCERRGALQRGRRARVGIGVV